MPRRTPHEEAATVTSARRPARSADQSGRELRDDADVLGLQTLGSTGSLELDLLVLLERTVAVRRDRAEVREDVGRAVIGGDEAEALVGVEPLDGSGSHNLFLL